MRVRGHGRVFGGFVMANRVHGGPDALGAAPWDFSSNANAWGPCPAARRALEQTDPTRYPDPTYTSLKSELARFHRVEVGRVLLAASASECIQRLTSWCWREGVRQVWTPLHAYGDYAHAASAWGLEPVVRSEDAGLVWFCDPGSPLGQNESPEAVSAALAGRAARAVVLDCAYAPLRLHGEGVLDTHQLAQVWQLWSPNKALGLTGVRAAYAIAPEGAQAEVCALERLAPSWPLGAHGVSLLRCWVDPGVQLWVADSRGVLVEWVQALRSTLLARGWTCLASATPYLCARPPAPLDPAVLLARGVKLRDATSFGLPGWWRLSAQPPEALAALDSALDAALGARVLPMGVL